MKPLSNKYLLFYYTTNGRVLSRVSINFFVFFLIFTSFFCFLKDLLQEKIEYLHFFVEISPKYLYNMGSYYDKEYPHDASRQIL